MNQHQRQVNLKAKKKVPGAKVYLSVIWEYRNNVEFCPLQGSDHQIRVCNRRYPLNKKELTTENLNGISVPCEDQIVVHDPKFNDSTTKYYRNNNSNFTTIFTEPVIILSTQLSMETERCGRVLGVALQQSAFP
jgi:hypothetical protein